MASSTLAPALIHRLHMTDTPRPGMSGIGPLTDIGLPHHVDVNH